MSRARDKANSTVSNFASTGIDDNADANAITIDSSENVLVGATSNNSANVGHGFQADGFVYHTRDGGAMLRLNRLTSDGEIQQFQKGGTTVGSIGVGNSSSYIYIGTGDTGLMFNSGNDFIQPWNPSTNGSKDSGIDLGNAGNRFRNLYLSSGAYIGGTGSANKLDDYEEGTFTPTFNGVSGNPTVTYTAQNGSYVKVGTLCLVMTNISWSAFSGGSGSFRVGNLPFEPNTQNDRRAVGSMAYINGLTGLTNAYGIEPHTNMSSASAGTYFYYKGSTGNISSYINCSNVGSSGTIQVSLVYQTT